MGGLPLGFVFAFIGTPCIGPIIGSAPALAATNGSATHGAALLSVYSAGIAVPASPSRLGLTESCTGSDGCGRGACRSSRRRADCC
jgi:cytochrome c-type biogenesis protein